MGQSTARKQELHWVWNLGTWAQVPGKCLVLSQAGSWVGSGADSNHSDPGWVWLPVTLHRKWGLKAFLHTSFLHLLMSNLIFQVLCFNTSSSQNGVRGSSTSAILCVLLRHSARKMHQWQNNWDLSRNSDIFYMCHNN